jgi:hypothetical protein
MLMLEDPVAFLTILDYNLSIVEKRGGGWVRLNGTSDIPWEEGPAVVEMMEKYSKSIDFADYTKASPEQRPAPTINNYRLARSVWMGKHDAFDIIDLLRQGEKVSMVVDHPEKFRRTERGESRLLVHLPEQALLGVLSREQRTPRKLGAGAR